MSFGAYLSIACWGDELVECVREYESMPSVTFVVVLVSCICAGAAPQHDD